MRILIVGAGIAGLTLAALLKQRGINPTVIERTDSLGEVGYMLGLYPVGADVLRQIHVYQQYLEISVAGDQYEAYTDAGKLLKRFSFAPIVARYGPYQLITRYELLGLIHQACDDLTIRFNTQVASLQQQEQEVEVVFDDKAKETFDLVVGADGLHSQIRNLILTPKNYRYFNTGWGGWVWWCNEDTVPDNTIQEFWGAGTFFGAYPVKGKVGVVAAVDTPVAEKILQDKSRKEFIQDKFSSIASHHPDFFKNLPEDDELVFFWSLNDQRADAWHRGRVVLLGDSAAGFLPTAGIGATMALESAAVLNDILSRTGVEFIPHALQLFEKRRRERVEKAQNDSRRLAKMMFVSSSAMAWMRNSFTRFMSAESLMNNIIKGFDEPI